MKSENGNLGMSKTTIIVVEPKEKSPPDMTVSRNPYADMNADGDLTRTGSGSNNYVGLTESPLVMNKYMRDCNHWTNRLFQKKYLLLVTSVDETYTWRS